MPDIHEVATLTSKGQITLPNAHPAGNGAWTPVAGAAFDPRGGEVIVTRADADHEDPAIEAFLGLLRPTSGPAARPVLPDDLAKAMLANAGHAVNLDEDIDGEVAL